MRSCVPGPHCSVREITIYVLLGVRCFFSAHLCSAARRIERCCCSCLFHAVRVHSSRARCLQPAFRAVFFRAKRSVCKLFVYLEKKDYVTNNWCALRRQETQQIYLTEWTNDSFDVVGIRCFSCSTERRIRFQARWYLTLRVSNP